MCKYGGFGGPYIELVSWSLRETNNNRAASHASGIFPPRSFSAKEGHLVHSFNFFCITPAHQASWSLFILNKHPSPQFSIIYTSTKQWRKKMILGGGGGDALWYHCVLANSNFKGVVVEGSKHFCGFYNHIKQNWGHKGGGPPLFTLWLKPWSHKACNKLSLGGLGACSEINSSAFSRYFNENQKHL